MPQAKHARKKRKLAATGGLEICRGRHTSKPVGMFSFSFFPFCTSHVRGVHTVLPFTLQGKGPHVGMIATRLEEKEASAAGPQRLHIWRRCSNAVGEVEKARKRD